MKQFENTTISNYVVKEVKVSELPFDSSTELMERDFVKVIIEFKPYNTVDCFHYVEIYKKLLEINLLDILTVDVKQLNFIKDRLNSSIYYVLQSEDANILDDIRNLIGESIYEQYLPVVLDIDTADCFTIEDLLKIRRNEDKNVSSYEKLLGKDFFEIMNTVEEWKKVVDDNKKNCNIQEETDVDNIVF